MDNPNKQFYFLVCMLIIMMICVVLFQGFTRGGIILLLILNILLWKLYYELYGNYNTNYMETMNYMETYKL